MNVKNALGAYSIKDSKNFINKQAIAEGGGYHKRPENYQEIENDKNLVFVWGDESHEELVEKVISQELELRLHVGVLILTVLITFQREKVIHFIKLLETKDLITYNNFKSKTEYFQRFNIESKKWYEFWK
ncbi:MAG: Uncharacterised protein [Flavobacteriaceae bacterium]|nr:MAG: Uncharacterised protein [Flavobacteriaceae bacterium]